MADEGEEFGHALNQQEPNDPPVIMPSGYTAVEQYLNELAEWLVRSQRLMADRIKKPPERPFTVEQGF